MFVTHYLHEWMTAPDGTLLILDVCDTGYSGFEGAFHVVDKDTFAEKWYEEFPLDEYDDFTDEEMRDYYEEYIDFPCWEPVSNNHRTGAAAEKKLRKYIRENFTK